MDFWDLTKLIWRRWYFAVPFLIATFVGTGFVATTTQPEYILTAHVLLTPAPQGDGSEETRAIIQSNPWNSLGVNALAQSAKLSIEGEDVIESLADQGLSDSYTVTIDNFSPIITVEVVAPTQQQAMATANALTALFATSVEQLQTSQGAVTASLMGVQRLPGDKIQESDSNVKRAVVAVGAAGVLLSLGITVALDALVRRRREVSPIDPFVSGSPLPSSPLPASPLSTSPLPSLLAVEPVPGDDLRIPIVPSPVTMEMSSQTEAPTSPVPLVLPRRETPLVQRTETHDSTVVLPPTGRRKRRTRR